MYSQVYYILAEDPNIGILEAFKKSEKLMKGKKLQLFVFSLRFMFYAFLGIFTLLNGAQVVLASMHQLSSIFLVSASVYFLYLNKRINSF